MKARNKLKVAFVIPFAFERFFHDARDVWDSPDRFEKEFISKRTTFHVNWCRAMQSAGMDVTLYYLSAFGNVVKEYTHDVGIKLKRVPTDFNKRMSGAEISFALLKELYKDKPDVVFSVTHMLAPPVDMYDILALFCAVTGIPLVARNAAGDTYGDIFMPYFLSRKKYSSLYKERKNNPVSIKRIFRFANMGRTYIRSMTKYLVKRLSLKATSFIIPQTKLDYQNLLSRFGINKERITVLPKPVDLTNFREMSKNIAAAHLGMDPSFKYILHVSNLYNTKGCEHIINILPDLIEVHPKLRLLVSGDGPKKKDLQSIANKLGLNERVVFLGQVEHSELVYFYNIADVFVLPTERVVGEGQPNVLLEAIACNTPPVSTNIPGPSALISEGLGLLVSIGKEDELLQGVKKVLNGEFKIEYDKRMDFIKKYSFKNIGVRLNVLFKKIVNER